VNKKRLGKGLSALIPDIGPGGDGNSSAGRKIVELSLDEVQPNPGQPRREFDQDKLEKMAQTILKYGIIQPILVVESDDMYKIIAGERRYKAAKLAGLETIPAEICDYSRDQYMEIALIENLQREDLNPIEEGVAYQQLIETFHLTQDEVAQRLGRSRSAITNTIRLLALPEKIKQEIIAGRLTQGQARPLLSLQNEIEQQEYAQKIINEKLTARQVEKIVQDRKEKNKSEDISRDKQEVKIKNNDLKDVILLEMEEKLRRVFGTKVSIKAGKNEGKVEFLYYNDDDLERLLQLFLNP